MIRLGRMIVAYLNDKGEQVTTIGEVIINNDIVNIDNGKIVLFKERIILMKKGDCEVDMDE